MVSITLLRLAVARVLIAAGHTLMVGTAVAVPVIFFRFEPGFVLITAACTFLMLIGLVLISGGDRLAPLAAVARRASARSADRCYSGMPVALRR